MSAASWHIARAARSDANDITAMVRALAEYERLTHLVQGNASDLADALFGEHPAAEALIAREGEKSGIAAGFALFFHTFSTFLGRRGLWLEDLFVYPRFRGRGLGKRLLGEVAATARARNCGRLEWAVLDWNAPAIAFYEGMGAVLMPEWRLARVTGDALEMFGKS